MATRKIETEIALSGERAFNDGMKAINSSLKTLKSDMALVSAEFRGNADTVEALKAKQSVLQQQYDQQSAKVEALRAHLENVKTEYGENSAQADKYRQQLNAATAQQTTFAIELQATTEALKAAKNPFSGLTSAVSDLAKEQLDKIIHPLAGVKDALKNMTADDIKSGLSALKSRMGDLFKTALSAPVDILKGSAAALVDLGKAAAEAAISIGKSAVDSYADYEQLSGGIDTLFGEAADRVKENMNFAFMTAGLSANEYAETATSVAASLTASFDATKEGQILAAQAIDQAVIDMADNANKMGTDMASVQTAYAGFAKGQYNLLDNLKLGYGGTKEEMERLLKDAEAFSGVEYDIDNLADVYSAIHVIQGELGVTGTTAKEASATISGSAATMKAAWENFKVSLADPNGATGQSAEWVIKTAKTYLDNLVPVIETLASETGPQALQAFSDAIIELAPELADTAESLITTLADSASEMLPVFVDLAMDIIEILVGKLTELGPEVLTAGVDILVKLITGISQTLPQLIPQMIQAILTMVNTLTSEDNLAQLVNAGIDLIIQLTVGLVQAIPELVPALLKAVGTIVDTLWDRRGDIVEAGKDLIRGLWEGIEAMWQWLWDKVSGFFGGLVSGVKSFLGIASPSKLFQDDIGRNMALGVGEGFSDEMREVNDEIARSINTRFDLNPDVRLRGSSAIYPAAPSGEDLQNLMSGVVNGIQTAVTGQQSAPGAINVNLTLPDGTTILRYFIDLARANGTPIANQM